MNFELTPADFDPRTLFNELVSGTPVNHPERHSISENDLRRAPNLAIVYKKYINFFKHVPHKAVGAYILDQLCMLESEKLLCAVQMMYYRDYSQQKLFLSVDAMDTYIEARKREVIEKNIELEKEKLNEIENKRKYVKKYEKEMATEKDLRDRKLDKFFFGDQQFFRNSKMKIVKALADIRSVDPYHVYTLKRAEEDLKAYLKEGFMRRLNEACFFYDYTDADVEETPAPIDDYEEEQDDPVYPVNNMIMENQNTISPYQGAEYENNNIVHYGNGVNIQEL